MIGLALAASGCAHVQLESIDAPDLDLRLTVARPEDSTGDPLGAAVVGGLSAVFASGGVAAEDGGYSVVLDAVRYQDRVVAEQSHSPPAMVREGLVRTTWRVVGPDGAVVDALDDVGTTARWVSSGETLAEAQATLIGADAAARELAASAGAAMAHRLIGLRRIVRRRVYGGGALRVGARALRAGDVDHALVLLHRLAEGTADPRLAARAHHDLAVAHEMAGDYAAAWAEARAAVDPHYAEALAALVREYRPLLRAPAGGWTP